MDGINSEGQMEKLALEMTWNVVYFPDCRGGRRDG